MLSQSKWISEWGSTSLERKQLPKVALWICCELSKPDVHLRSQVTQMYMEMQALSIFLISELLLSIGGHTAASVPEVKLASFTSVRDSMWGRMGPVWGSGGVYKSCQDVSGLLNVWEPSYLKEWVAGEHRLGEWQYRLKDSHTEGEEKWIFFLSHFESMTERNWTWNSLLYSSYAEEKGSQLLSCVSSLLQPPGWQWVEFPVREKK